MKNLDDNNYGDIIISLTYMDLKKTPTFIYGSISTGEEETRQPPSSVHEISVIGHRRAQGEMRRSICQERRGTSHRLMVK